MFSERHCDGWTQRWIYSLNTLGCSPAWTSPTCTKQPAASVAGDEMTCASRRWECVRVAATM